MNKTELRCLLSGVLASSKYLSHEQVKSVPKPVQGDIEREEALRKAEEKRQRKNAKRAKSKSST